jgi:small-conductance mechanosensitive channel
MGELLSQEALAETFNEVWEWIQLNVLTLSTAIQLGAIAVAFGLALLISRVSRPWLERNTNHAVAGKAARILLPLWFPLIWALLLWISTTTATTLGWPNRLLDSVTGLVFVWVAIRLVSQLVRNPLFANVIVWTAWTIAALNILGWDDDVIRILQSATLIEVGDDPTTEADDPTTVISLYTIVVWTISLAALLSIAVYLSGFLESRIRTIRTLSPSLQVLFIKSLKIVLITLAIIIAINSVGIDLTALAVFGGALGVGVGFGLQRVVGNLISGVILLVDKSIKPGDVIAVSGTYGWVTALGGRYVSVVTRDGVEHLIPNEMLISERVENWTHSHSRTRLKANIGVHYASDVHQVIELCIEAAAESERVLTDPAPKCLLIEFGVQNITSEILLRVWDKFKEAGVEIPYPQRDLHLRSGFERMVPSE